MTTIDARGNLHVGDGRFGQKPSSSPGELRPSSTSKQSIIVDADLLYGEDDPADRLREELAAAYPGLELGFMADGDLERWHGVELTPEVVAKAAERDHVIEDHDGWSCGSCHLPVNGYVRDRERGDAVFHLAPD